MPTNKHHLFFERSQYQRYPIAKRVREHPVNIYETEIWKHRQLHQKSMGGLAVISYGLGSEVLEYLGDIKDPKEDQLKHIIGEQMHLDQLSRRKGIIGREAYYFARALEFQIEAIR